jgi:hypothetical protein
MHGDVASGFPAVGTAVVIHILGALILLEVINSHSLPHARHGSSSVVVV